MYLAALEIANRVMPSSFLSGGYWGIASMILDFTLIASIIYVILLFLKGSRTVYTLGAFVVVLGIIVLAARFLNLKVLDWIISGMLPVLAVMIAIVFQPEIRKGFAIIGSQINKRQKLESEAIEEIVKACVQMSQRYCGALIVFENQIGMAATIKSAVELDIKINSLILQSIFFPNSPLHDCAVIIKDGRIVAAHAVLPLAKEIPLGISLGTRHRAAIGITEETDALAIVVSEENGTISVAYKGRLIKKVSETELLAFLRNRLVGKDQNSRIMEMIENAAASTPVAFLKQQDEEGNGK